MKGNAECDEVDSALRTMVESMRGVNVDLSRVVEKAEGLAVEFDVRASRIERKLDAMIAARRIGKEA